MRLPLEISTVTRTNLLQALEAVRGCLKTTSMLWMRVLGVPVLSGVVVRDWSKSSAAAVDLFCKRGKFSDLLLRIDKQHERWARRRGGYLVSRAELSGTVKELQREGRIAILLEPKSPYVDQYSLAGVTVPENQQLIVEVVGPGFDASDLLRSDIQPHERWQLSLNLGSKQVDASSTQRLYLTTPERYRKSVEQRLAKIGARTRNPSFPDEILGSGGFSRSELVRLGAGFLKNTHQALLLRHADMYAPIPPKHLSSFVGNVQKLLQGLAGYGIHLGPSSFAASVLPNRGLIFWDFFPARSREAESLYPARLFRRAAPN